RHGNERDIHEQVPSRSLLFAFRPTCCGIPEKKESTNQAQGAEHVFARGSSYVHASTGPDRILFAELRVILYEQDGKRNQQRANAAEDRADSLQWVRVG